VSGLARLCSVAGSGFKVQGSGFKVQGSGFKVQGSKVQGSEIRGQGSVVSNQGSGANAAFTWIKKSDLFSLLLAISVIKLILRLAKNHRF